MIFVFRHESNIETLPCEKNISSLFSPYFLANDKTKKLPIFGSVMASVVGMMCCRK